MRFDLKALAALMRPITAEESSVMSALEWLTTERLSERMRMQFYVRIEEVLESVLSPAEMGAQKGCHDADRYRGGTGPRRLREKDRVKHWRKSDLIL